MEVFSYASSMTNTILILLAVSLDVFSFGISLGVEKVRLKFHQAIFFTLVSLLIFLVPLLLSKLISKFIPANICYFINGSVLLVMGMCYLTSYLVKWQPKALKIAQNSPNLTQTDKSCEINNKNVKFARMGLKSLAMCAVPVNLDAFFTALLSGFAMGNVVIVLSIYLCVTFLAVVIGNAISFFLSKRLQFDLSWASGILFIVLGVFKLLEAI